jgi:hypothetical protein
MKRTRASVAAFLVLGGLSLFDLFGGARVSEALHRNTPFVVQITSGPAQVAGGPSFAGKSNVLLFHSDADLLGNGNDVPQIFAFDLASRSKKGLQGIFQITFGDQPSLAPTGARRGRTLAFHSTADHLANGSTGRQVFAAQNAIWKKGIVPLIQVTRGSGESFGPVLSEAGRYLVFSSDADLTGAGLGPGVRLYRSELRRIVKSACPGYPCPADGNPGLVLITPEEASSPTIDKKGERVAFVSSGDAAGTGCVTGASQIFVRNFFTDTIEQLTCGTADSRHPVFTKDNRALLFESDADLAGTGSTRTQIFMVSLQLASRPITQMTFGTDGDSTSPAPNGTKTLNRFFFASTATFGVPVPPGAPRLYEYVQGTGLARLTDGQAVEPPLTGQFTFVAFASDADLAGNGNADPQVFLINAHLAPPLAATPVATPTPTVTPTSTPQLLSLTLTPVTRTLDVGEVQNYTTTGHYTGGGTQNLTQQVDYASSNPAVAVATNTAGNKSRVEAVGAGTATISATDAVTGISTTDSGNDATLTVLGALERLTIAPLTKTIAVGQSQSYTVTGHYEGGGTKNLTQQVDYASSDPAVAVATNMAGNKSRVDGVGAGTATISATESVTGIGTTDSGDDATLTVVP